MQPNELVLVENLIRAEQAERDTPLADDVAFEGFAASMVLRDRNLNADEVEAGRVAGGKDGGIDAVYTFLDDELLDDDADIFSDEFTKPVRKTAELTLRIIQAKQEQSFSETALDKVSSSLGRLLDLSQRDDKLRVLYSDALISRIRLFTRAWTLLGVRSPLIRIEFDYVTKGDTSSVGPPVEQKCRDLESLIKDKVPGSVALARCVGSKELWELARTEPTYDLQLRFSEYFSKGESYTGLVNLADYYEFLSAPDGELLGHLFDWNVRDFQGGVKVNRDIQTTLESEDSDDFWWLNNGVTILCSNVSIVGDKTFTMENVQIVNGMQTSYSIHAAIKELGVTEERKRARSVLVRVFKTQDAATRDRVIRATNSQTKVPDASLHATEEIHRKIESYFAANGWFYDRRKNFYKNKGKPADRIVSIAFLGQAVMAIGLGRPNDARARPSTLLNTPADYKNIFDDKLPLSTYLWLAQVQRAVDRVLLQPGVADPWLRTNLRFYVSLFLVTQLHGGRIYSPKQLSKHAETPFVADTEAIVNAFNLVLDLAENSISGEDWSLDRVAKSRQFTDDVIDLAVDGAG